MIKMTHTAAALATALCLISGAALGATPDIAKSPALTKIQNNNVLVVGHRTSSIPFSYYDANQKPIGFAQDICNKLIAKIKEVVKKPELNVRLIPVTPQKIGSDSDRERVWQNV